MPAVYEVVPVEAGHAWRLVGADDILLAVGTAPYRTPEAARAAAEAFRAAASASDASVEVSDGDQGASWTLVLGGRVLGRSPGRLGDAAEAGAAVEAVREAAAADVRGGTDASVDRGFDTTTLDKATIALPLLKQIEASPANVGHRIIIDINLLYPGGREAARKRVVALIEALAATTPPSGMSRPKILHRSAGATSQYVVARLSGDHVRRLVRYDRSVAIDLAASGSPEAADTDPVDERDPDFERALRTVLLQDARALALETRTRQTDARRPEHEMMALAQAVMQTGAIYRVWPDFEVRPMLTDSIPTIKGDAARVAFSALGAGIVWAVVDSGVDGTHPHFETHGTLDLKAPLYHRDFTLEEQVGTPSPDPTALTDPFGHGTHVAGIIAGEHDPEDYTARERAKREEARRKAAEARAASGDGTEAESEDAAVGEEPIPPLLKVVRQRSEESERARYETREVGAISGVAPQAKVLSLRVLNEKGKGHTSDIIEALRYVHDLNQGGRFIVVHGVNLSVGYEFDAEWFACGHSPLCQEVDLLVRSGVVVVTAAGNTGYGELKTRQGTWKAGHDLSINDPGNAERAITVGATHPREPHRYGVSFFSSKGPTGDGRIKPDLVAPGEKVISCAAGHGRTKAQRELAVQENPAAPFDPEAATPCHYLAESGTSMAAPHVSGAVAAFLSIRREFIGRSEDVKQLFLDNATDLGRDPYFQGHGLLDLMRTIQAV